MVIKLYSHPRSTHGKIVSMVLLEKEIPFEFIKIDFASRQQKTSEYLAMNPFGEVPCIVRADYHEVHTYL
jgi:glutathione S-transferase